MFTGLVEKTGTLVSVERDGEAARLCILAKAWEDSFELGESISVEGVCLTLTRFDEVGDAWELSFDVLGETLRRTTLGDKVSGDALNLERALRFGDAVGGHLVSGHVDGTGTLCGLHRSGRDHVLEIHGSPDLLEGIIYKGSVAVNGISLTIAELGDDSFSVHIIPHTWDVTSLRNASEGERVNLEVDAMGKYVKKYVDALGH